MARLSSGKNLSTRSVETAIQRLQRQSSEKQTMGDLVELPVYALDNLPTNLANDKPFLAFVTDSSTGATPVIWYNGTWYKISIGALS